MDGDEQINLTRVKGGGWMEMIRINLTRVKGGGWVEDDQINLTRVKGVGLVRGSEMLGLTLQGLRVGVGWR